MFRDTQLWADIRRRVLVEHVSKRQILRETGMYWRTLEKILAHPEPPAYRAPASRASPKLGPYLDRIARILEEDTDCPRKQRHTAKRIFDRIAAEGYEGGYTAVKKAVCDLKRIRSEVFAPLIHRMRPTNLSMTHNSRWSEVDPISWTARDVILIEHL